MEAKGPIYISDFSHFPPNNTIKPFNYISDCQGPVCSENNKIMELKLNMVATLSCLKRLLTLTIPVNDALMTGNASVNDSLLPGPVPVSISIMTRPNLSQRPGLRGRV